MARWFYNRAVDKMENTKNYNFYSLRNSMRNDKKEFNLPDWVENKKLYCSKIISEAIHDATKSYKSSFKLLKKKLISHFKISYKNKKQRFQTISLEKECFGKNNNILPTFLGKMKSAGYKEDKMTITYPEIEIKKSCKLQYDRILKTYVLFIPFSEENKISSDNQAEKYDFISLDTGVRTFQTGYCPQGHTIK